MRKHPFLGITLVVLVVLACRPPWDGDEEESPTPKAPSNLKSLSTSPNEVQLQWSDNSKNETGFRIWRNNVSIETIEKNSTTYADKTVRPSTSYKYRVEAFNDYGANSSGSLTVSTPADNVPSPPPGAPKEPTNVIAKCDFHQITLTWKDNANNETGYVVERANFKKELDRNSTSFIDENLDFNTSYSYEIYAVNATDESYHATITAKTRGSFQVRWNKAMDRKEVNGQVVENGWASSYEVFVEPTQGAAFVAYAGPDTSCVVEIDKPFCATVTAIDSKGNKSPRSDKVCSR